MARRITAATLILAAACGTQLRIGGNSNALSYAQHQSLEQGMEARAILRAFGKPQDVLEQDGKVRGLTYACETATGAVESLRMVFSPDERLDRWTLGGAASPKASSG
jgi:hypothetical protein